MGLLSGVLGLDSETDVRDVQEDLGPILVPGETVDLAFQVVRDLLVFTDHRMIIVDKQGVTGRKRRIQSIPYRAITTFCVETAGSLDKDSELTVWVSGQPPLVRHLSRRTDVTGIQRALAAGVFARR